VARVRVEGIEKRFVASGRSVDALCGLSLDVADGTCTAILGPSGCGKTTLLRAIAGLEKPDAGRVSFDDRDVTDDPVERRGVGMVFQSDALFPHLTAYENVAYGLAHLERGERDARVRDAARRMHVAELLDRSARALSGGERQRVAVARALAPAPHVVLLDEPFSRLDAPLRSALRVELKLALRETHATSIFVTHDQSEAMALADRIAVVRAGRVEQVGSPRELYDLPATQFVASFVGSPAMSFVAAEALPFRADVPAAVRFGFRPDAVRLADAGDIAGVVRAIEDFGADAYAYVETPHGTIVARAPANLPALDARVGLAFERAGAHPFDASGARVPEFARV
jgi:multiple sugar transport system ATP-binding protein